MGNKSYNPVTSMFHRCFWFTLTLSSTNHTEADSFFQFCKPGQRLQEKEEERACCGAAAGPGGPEGEQDQPGAGRPPRTQCHPDAAFH